MKKQIILIGLSLILLFACLCGCTEQTKDNNNEQTPDNNLENIIGNWYKEEFSDDITYVILYEFYLNSSFYSGVWDSYSSTVSNYVRGNYEFLNDKIYLNVTGDNESSSLIKYLISEDGNNLTLYHEDGENYDVFTRES